MRFRNRLFILLRIQMRMLLLIKVMQICDYWSTGPPGLHCKPPRLHFERPQRSNSLFTASKVLFYFNADSDPDPDPAVHAKADLVPYPASKKNLDPDPRPCYEHF